MNSHANVQPAVQPATQRPVIHAQQLAIRHLRTRAEIETIMHLRDAIDLSVHAAAPQFLAREKKETNAVLSGLSNCRGKSSGRSGSCPCRAA